MAMASRGAVGALEASVPARLGTAGLAEAIGRMAQLVEHSRERIRLLEAVIENFPGGVSLFDQDLNMVICNQRQRTLLDYPDDLFANGYPSMEMLFASTPSAVNTGRAKSSCMSRAGWRWSGSARRMSTSGPARTGPSSRCAACRSMAAASSPPISTLPSSAATRRRSPTWHITTR
ncbi:hypothetical protein EN857_03725 [Mesorhizobium sp. M4B.F.Ca.ET.214.01.1.1]|nr:hypothetical protein EN857_03725 [Mesorhizobium sp. M4B.F.Ca.ET.214.01.1.1]TGQ62054.1 hypothetical protein EN854_03725 [Mesorhizobium sp. M4B.F.Ca.ET.211.01.1.1]TGU39259.1 hypothetical protein EN793_03725 [Mesorhizobium sp. M4B.F.Ca.ET.150.01.1.1]